MIGIDNNTGNSSNGSFSTDFFVYGNKIPWTVAFSLQFLSSIIGNLLVVWIVYKDSRLKNTTNYLVVNVAVSDLFAAFFGFPSQVVWINFDGVWLVTGAFGNVLCKFSTFSGYVFFIVSVYSCVFIAIDRCCAVLYPMKRPFENRIKYIIIGIWTFSGLLYSPILYFVSVGPTDGIFGYVNQCGASPENRAANVIFIYVVITLNTVVSVPVFTTSYILTVYKLYQHRVPGEPQTDFTLRRRQQQNKTVFKMSVSIVVMAYISLSFWIILRFLHNQGALNHLSRSALIDLEHTTVFVLYMSLVYNIYIYLIFNHIYRENIRIIMRKCFCSSVRNEVGSSSSTAVPRACYRERPIEIHVVGRDNHGTY